MPIELETANVNIEFALGLIPSLDKVGFRWPQIDPSQVTVNSELLMFWYRYFSELEDMAEKALEQIRAGKREIGRLLEE